MSAYECGCDNREGHIEPAVDPILGVKHGERFGDDPLPHDVPGTDYQYCLCGHPNYAMCEGWPFGGVAGLTIIAAGGE